MQEKQSKRKKKSSIDLFEYGKVPPHAIELEKAVISACLVDKTVRNDVLKFIKPEMFYNNEHQLIFKAICSLWDSDRPVDMLTVSEELKKTGDLEIAGGAYYVSQLARLVGSGAHVEYHARIVFQKYIKREIINNTSKLFNEAFEDSADVFDLMEKFDRLSVELRATLDKPEVTSDKLADAFIKELDSDIPNNPTSIYVTRKIGFPSFDKIISWAPNKLLLLAGAAKDGKTKIMSMMVFQLLKNDSATSVYWVTLEDTDKDILASFLAQYVYQKPKNILSKKGMNNKRIDVAKQAAEVWKSYDVTFYDQSTTIASIKSRFKAWCETKKDRFKVLVIDNLLSLADKDNPNFMRNVNGLYDYVIGTCADIKRDTNSFIFLLHHFRDSQGDKSNVESGFRPHVSDIKGTEASRRTPNYVLLMNNPSRRKELLNQYDDKKLDALKNLIIIDPAAIRDEDNTGDNALIRLYADLNYTHFLDLS